MAFPMGMTLEKLEEVGLYINEYIAENIADFTEIKFLEYFVENGEFVFSNKRFYNLDEVVLAEFLYRGIGMEYGEILKDSKGNEFSPNQCKDLVRWFIGHDYTSKGWKNRSELGNNFFDPGLCFYYLFRDYIRSNIHPGLSVKAKIETRDEAYYFFIGLQASKKMPEDMTPKSLYEQYFDKRDKIIQQSMVLEKAFKNYKRKTTKSAARCFRFLRTVAKKIKTNRSLNNEIGELIDFYIKSGVTCTNQEASKLVNQIRSTIFQKI